MRDDYMIIRMMIITVKKKNVFYFDIFRSISVCVAQACVEGPGMDNWILSKLSVLQTYLYSSSKQYSHHPHTAL